MTDHDPNPIFTTPYTLRGLASIAALTPYRENEGIPKNPLSLEPDVSEALRKATEEDASPSLSPRNARTFEEALRPAEDMWVGALQKIQEDLNAQDSSLSVDLEGAGWQMQLHVSGESGGSDFGSLNTSISLTGIRVHADLLAPPPNLDALRQYTLRTRWPGVHPVISQYLSLNLEWYLHVEDDVSSVVPNHQGPEVGLLGDAPFRKNYSPLVVFGTDTNKLINTLMPWVDARAYAELLHVGSLQRVNQLTSQAEVLEGPLPDGGKKLAEHSRQLSDLLISAGQEFSLLEGEVTRVQGYKTLLGDQWTRQRTPDPRVERARFTLLRWQKDRTKGPSLGWTLTPSVSSGAQGLSQIDESLNEALINLTSIERTLQIQRRALDARMAGIGALSATNSEVVARQSRGISILSLLIALVTTLAALAVSFQGTNYAKAQTGLACADLNAEQRVRFRCPAFLKPNSQAAP